MSSEHVAPRASELYRPLGLTLDDVQRNDAYDRASAPVELPEGEAIALRITRVEG